MASRCPFSIQSNWLPPPEEPSRVSFGITIYDVETGRRLWRGRFNWTQKILTENILLARQYAGGGTRWLAVTELARWGAAEMVRSFYDGP